MKKLAVLITLLVAFLAAPSSPVFSRPSVPTPTDPPNGSRVDSFSPTVAWAVSPGTQATQFHLQAQPFNGDGPALDMIFASENTWYTLPAPPSWYGLLPDITYTWQVRLSDASTSVGVTDPSWSDWSPQWSFKTPLVAAATIQGVSPSTESQVDSLTPTLVWSDSNPNVWYYEVQISKDQGFGPSVFLYWELRHGGVTSPPRSYAIPAQFPLEAGQRYYWRVRPRIQGDGAPAAWSASFTFSTPSSGLGVRQVAQVTGILDGGAIEVLIGGARRTVRYLGITAPKVSPAECYGAQAAAKNSELVEGQIVQLEKDVTDADSSGRLLRYVYVGDILVNAELLRLGYVRATPVPPDVKFQAEFASHQSAAQSAKRGLWGACP